MHVPLSDRHLLVSSEPLNHDAWRALDRRTGLTAHETLTWEHHRKGGHVGKVVRYASVSVDGFIADEHDQPGPLFDWLSSGDVPLDASGVLKVSQTSYDYVRPYWDQIGVTIAGRHVF